MSTLLCHPAGMKMSFLSPQAKNLGRGRRPFAESILSVAEGPKGDMCRV